MIYSHTYIHTYIPLSIHDAILSTWGASMSGASTENFFEKPFRGSYSMVKLYYETKFHRLRPCGAGANEVGMVTCTTGGTLSRPPVM